MPAESLMEEYCACRANHNDRSHTEYRIGDHCRHTFKGQQQESGGIVIGDANQQPAQQVRRCYLLPLSQCKGQSNQQCSEKGAEQIEIFQNRWTGLIENIGHGVRKTADQGPAESFV